MPGVLAMGDFGREDCGVGSSEAVIARWAGDVDVLDTAAPGLWRFTRSARRLARRGASAVGVYPTMSTVHSVGLLPRALVLRLAFGRRRFRLHLHEFQHLRRLLKWPVTIVLLLAGRVVVSNESEAAAVRGALRGFGGRNREVVVAAPTNGTAPSADELAVAIAEHPDRARTVGVFGRYRPDKGADWLEGVLVELPLGFDRLVVAGGGWDQHEWSPAVRQRFALELLGHVPRSALAGLLGSWGLAVSPLWGPAQDGRMSVRTPLAFGVPTLSVGPRGADLTLTADHLVLHPPTDPSAIEPATADRAAGAAQVAAFEDRVAEALATALFG